MSKECIHQIENYWKVKTATSNEFYQQGKYEMAYSGYEQALYRAEVLNNHMDDAIKSGVPFIQVYIISCNNLAETALKLERKEESDKMYKRVVYYLLNLCKRSEVDQNIIQNELKRASLTYVDFLERTNTDPKQEDAFFKDLKMEINKQFYHEKI